MARPVFKTVPLLICLNCSPSNISVDLASQYDGHLVNAIGTSYPVKGVNIGAGVWGINYPNREQVGYYLSISKSFQPFKERK